MGNATIQQLLEVVAATKAYLESQSGPLWVLYDEGEIGCYEDHTLSWEEVLEKVRDVRVPIGDLQTPFVVGFCAPTSSEVLQLYRQVQAALETTG